MKTKDLHNNAYTPFLTIPGGKGNPADVVAEPNNHYSVLTKTKYPYAVKLQYSESGFSLVVTVR
ncbi:hypothetical protein ACWD4J_40680 [Streptomyces sp. NPDC002577]